MLKEQIIHGPLYRNIEELRVAAREFIETYNAQLARKSGHLSSYQVRHAWNETVSLRLAA